ncbi:MAG: hypothetical protein AAF270_11140 [Pseudomonadota bacterium]
MIRVTLQCLLLLVALANTGAHAAACAAPGRDGSGAFGGVLNTYWPGTNNPGAGATTLQLGSARGALVAVAAGDLLLVIQMQDASINRNNDSRYGDGINGDPGSGWTNLRRAGRFEFVRAVNSVGLGGGTLQLASGLQFDYSTQSANGGRGQRTFQVVRVPQYIDLTVAGTISAANWDGSSGGVVALDVAGTVSFAGGSIDVSGQGFRGGGGRASTTGSGSNTDYRTPSSNSANGSKGESIAGTPRFVLVGNSVVDNGSEGYPSGSFARGAPANGGGGGTDGRPSANDQNTGGGGGGGYADGGRGGHAWCPGGPSVCPQTGGFGGSGVAQQSVDLLTMGGGGGAGTTNNATGSPGGGVATSGAAGGGIVIVRAGRLSGAGGAIRADGADAFQTVGNDGSGGGGGGGAILFSVDSISGSTPSLDARGGRGGSNGNSTPHGPGGGGGGGAIVLSSNLIAASTNASAGQPGVTDGNPAPFTSNYGATSGGSAFAFTGTPSDIPGLSGGAECSVLVDKVFTPDLASAQTPVRLQLTVRNPNPTLALDNLSLIDNYPAAIRSAATPNATNSCGGSVTTSAGATDVSLTGATLAPLGSCSIEVDVVGITAGDQINTIAAGDANATIDGRAVNNALTATDTLTVLEPLAVTKVTQVVSDPVNGTSDAFAVPGAVIEYQITVFNPSTQSIDSNGVTLTDAIPDNVSFLNSDIGNGLPVALDDGAPASGLSLGAADIAFSNDDGSTYTYGAAAGIDPLIDAIQIVPSGALAPGTGATLRFRVVVD